MGSERVRESAMVRPGKDEFADAHLLDTAQALHLGGVDEFEQQTIAGGIGERDQIVDRITKHLGPVVTHGIDAPGERGVSTP